MLRSSHYRKTEKWSPADQNLVANQWSQLVDNDNRWAVYPNAPNKMFTFPIWNPDWQDKNGKTLCLTTLSLTEYISVDQDELIMHWHARAVEYILLHADNLDAWSIITFLRHGTDAANGSDQQHRWSRALNLVKIHLKNGCLTPIKAFNTITEICDNPYLPQQHAWPNKVETIAECVLNNMLFNTVTNYVTGWPIQFPDHPDSLVRGEVAGKQIIK